MTAFSKYFSQLNAAAYVNVMRLNINVVYGQELVL